MKTISTKYFNLILIIILIVSCILFNVIMSKRYYSEQAGSSGSDPVLYNTMAIAILNGNNYFMIGDTKADIGREVTPFYSALVAITYFVGGVNIRNPYILNVIFNCLAIVLLFLTIELITKKKFVSFLFSFVLIFYYPLWKMNFSIMMEVTTVFFISLTVYLFSKYYYGNKTKYLYFSTTAFSLLCLINNRFIILCFTFFVFLFIFTCIKKYSIQRVFLVPSLIALLIISPWFIRQYIVYDQFVFFTPLWNNVVSDGIGILKRVNIPTGADDKGADKPLEYEEYIKDLKGYNTEDIQQKRISAFTFEKYKEVIDRHNYQENIYMARLKKYFTLFYKDFQFTGPKDYRLVAPSTKPYKMIQIFILMPLFILSLFGFIISIEKTELLIIFFSALFFSHVLLHVLVHYIDRYRLTILPVLLIIAVYGFSEALRMLGESYYVNKFKERIYIT